MIRQTMTDWELILCDDGSHITYQPLIDEAIEMDERIIRIRNKTNKGLGYSLNQCLSIAKGKYIARMDEDDISEPERFRKQSVFGTACGIQWVGSNSRLFDEHGVWGADCVPERPEASDFLSYSPYIHPSVMFRAEVLRKIKGYPISEETRRCEDYELFMRLHKAGYRGYNLQEPLIRYREDEHTYRKRTIQSRMQEVKIRYRGFRQLGDPASGDGSVCDASAGSRAVSANGFKPDPAKYEKGVSCGSTCKDGMSSIGNFEKK